MSTIRKTAMHPDTPDILLDAAQAPSSPGHILEIHPDDVIGNESARALCAHYLGQDAPVTRPTLRKWRRMRGFPDPLPCHRAGVELWDARDVRVWAQAHAADLPKHRPARLRNTLGT